MERDKEKGTLGEELKGEIDMTTDSKIIAHKAYVLDILIDFIERYQDNLINNDVDEDIITYNSFVYALMYECNFEFGGDPLFFPVTLSFQRYEVSFSISANSKGVEFLVMTGNLIKASIDKGYVDCVSLDDVLKNLRDVAKVTYNALNAEYDAIVTEEDKRRWESLDVFSPKKRGEER